MVLYPNMGPQHRHFRWTGHHQPSGVLSESCETRFTDVTTATTMMPRIDGNSDIMRGRVFLTTANPRPIGGIT